MATSQTTRMLSCTARNHSHTHARLVQPQLKSGVRLGLATNVPEYPWLTAACTRMSSSSLHIVKCSPRLRNICGVFRSIGCERNRAPLGGVANPSLLAAVDVERAVRLGDC